MVKALPRAFLVALTYYDEYQGKPLTDLVVYAFIAQNITDIRGADAFNAGYCTGWLEALLEDRQGAALG